MPDAALFHNSTGSDLKLNIQYFVKCFNINTKVLFSALTTIEPMRRKVEESIQKRKGGRICRILNQPKKPRRKPRYCRKKATSPELITAGSMMLCDSGRITISLSGRRETSPATKCQM